MIHGIRIAILATLLCSAGCMMPELDDFALKDESELSKKVFDLIAAREFDKLDEYLDPQMRTEENRQRLNEMADHIPAGQPKKITPVVFRKIYINGVMFCVITHEYEYADSWLLTKADLERRDGKWVFRTVLVFPRKESLESENAIRLSERGPVHLTILALAFLIPAFIVYNLIACLRTKNLQRKWLWLLFISVGIIQLNFNWTTGAFAVQPLYFQLLGAAYHRYGLGGPYVISLAFPLGATLFRWKRKSILRQKLSEGTPRPDSGTSNSNDLSTHSETANDPPTS